MYRTSFTRLFNLDLVGFDGDSRSVSVGSDGALLFVAGFLHPFLDFCRDRKSTRLNSSHITISYAVFCLKKNIAMTESLAHCDIVLPAATHFEYADLYPSYGHHWLQRADAVIPPAGESLPNTEIFRRLAASFGFDEPCFKATDEALMDDAVDSADPRLAGLQP